MPSVYISEYSGMAAVPNNAAQMPQEPALASQVVAIGASSAQSAFFNPSTRFVRIHCDAICSIAFGVDPTADVAAGRFGVNQTEFRGVPEGGSMRLAVIANT